MRAFSACTYGLAKPRSALLSTSQADEHQPIVSHLLSLICRAFTAIKEGYGDTWISNNVQFINHYSPNGMALTSDEARGVPKAYVWLLALYWAMTTVGPPVYMHACGVAKINANLQTSDAITSDTGEMNGEHPTLTIHIFLAIKSPPSIKDLWEILGCPRGTC